MQLDAKKIYFLIVLMLGPAIVKAQDSAILDNDLKQQVDAYDVLRSIFGIKETIDPKPKKTSLSILPSFSYNPSFGFIIGASVNGGRQFGDPANTDYSTLSMYGS